jgi:hypothetical protein
MIFGPLEILLCLAPFMLIVFTIGIGLAAQNISLARRERELGQIRCPQCRGLLNAEAYICRFCSRELVGEYRVLGQDQYDERSF